MGLSSKLNINIGSLKKGKKNLITDVEGVMVGHVTLDKDNIKTGVTAILPHRGNIFQQKVMAASHVINGFGKSVGLVQIDELGSIETPIILTNTLSVGTSLNALTKYMLEQNNDIGVTTGTVNCTICECNDGHLNDIRGMHVKEKHILQAIQNASETFEEGAVGSGTGMVCYKLKGGIGSSSRIISLDGKDYTVGSLVMTNHGLKKDLTINGDNVGRRIEYLEKLDNLDGKGNYINIIDNNEKLIKVQSNKVVLEKNNLINKDDAEKGSIIVIIATDIPLSERQLKRVCVRSMAGIARTGSNFGNGSGDICIAFTNSNIINHYNKKAINTYNSVNDNNIDLIFRATIESVEESIISSLCHAKTTVGRDGHVVKSLDCFIDN